MQLRETGEPIGICGLLKRDTLTAPDIGFAFRPPYWSQGYAFEAASFVKTLARDQFKAPRLLAIVNPSNAPSIRLLTKLGLTFERMMRLTPASDEIALYGVAFDTIPPS